MYCIGYLILGLELRQLYVICLCASAIVLKCIYSLVSQQNQHPESPFPPDLELKREKIVLS